MQFNPCMEHKLILDSARHFAETELAPIAAEIDKNATLPLAVIEKMKQLNYFGLQVSRDFGGAGLDSVSAAIVMEELSRVAKKGVKSLLGSWLMLEHADVRFS